ncbi:MAG: hypothetical protein ACE5HT_13445 [Gemmatimonadales bacterium]
MPVTAKLSKKFYDTLGEDVTNELINWFNQVDTTYRTDLREFNELNFQRFDAKLEQRLAEMDVNWVRRLAEMDAKWTRRLAEMDAKWERKFAQLAVKIAGTKSELTKTMFVFWAGTVIPLGGLIIALSA